MSLPSLPGLSWVKSLPPGPALAVAVSVVLGMIYADLAFAVIDPADYRFFPPFKRGYNANLSRTLGGETYEIAKALLAGEGFAHPHRERTGPTAWTAPVHPAFLALLLWACDGDIDGMAAVITALKTAVLIGTGWLILLLARDTTSRVGSWLAAAAYVLLLFSSFRAWFQHLGGGWRFLLAVDLMLAGCCWWRPFDAPACRAAAWGVLGGLCALVSPIIGFTWAVLSLLAAGRRGAWSRLAVALLAAGLTVSPWIVRNYLVLGRLIPVKSNLAYELYQSQCMQPDGLLQRATLASHPHMNPGTERAAYRTLGEVAFLDRKRAQFLGSVAADPLGFIKRVTDRFLGAVVWYVPFDRAEDTGGPVLLWLQRSIHVLPLLGLLALVYGPGRQPLHGAQWVVVGTYVFYLVPYIVISYYDSYAMALLSVKALLVIWGADQLLSWRRGAPRASEAESRWPPGKGGKTSCPWREGPGRLQRHQNPGH
jgi:hypothetical protein